MYTGAAVFPFKLSAPLEGHRRRRWVVTPEYLPTDSLLDPGGSERWLGKLLLAIVADQGGGVARTRP